MPVNGRSPRDRKRGATPVVASQQIRPMAINFVETVQSEYLLKGKAAPLSDPLNLLN
jgi:hypothetical protein